MLACPIKRAISYGLAPASPSRVPNVWRRECGCKPFNPARSAAARNAFEAVESGMETGARKEQPLRACAQREKERAGERVEWQPLVFARVVLPFCMTEKEQIAPEVEI